MLNRYCHTNQPVVPTYRDLVYLVGQKFRKKIVKLKIEVHGEIVKNYRPRPTFWKSTHKKLTVPTMSILESTFLWICKAISSDLCSPVSCEIFSQNDFYLKLNDNSLILKSDKFRVCFPVWVV